MEIAPSPGCAERVRRWYLELVAGRNPAVPPELLPKIRLLESIVPFGGRLLGLKAKTIADLVPDDDETVTAMLGVVHLWTGRMLTGEPPLGPGPEAAPLPAPARTEDEATDPDENTAD